MSPPFHDGSFFQHQDEVGVLDSAQAVGDDQGGTVCNELVDGLLDMLLGL